MASANMIADRRAWVTPANVSVVAAFAVGSVALFVTMRPATQRALPAEALWVICAALVASVASVFINRKTEGWLCFSAVGTCLAALTDGFTAVTAMLLFWGIQELLRRADAGKVRLAGVLLTSSVGAIASNLTSDAWISAALFGTGLLVSGFCWSQWVRPIPIWQMLIGVMVGAQWYGSLVIGTPISLLLGLAILPLAERAAHLIGQIGQARQDSLMMLCLMLQRAQPHTQRHLRRVAGLSQRAARKLGFSRTKSRQIADAAMMHDIGKIAVDEEILDKPRRLTEEEFDHVRRHVTVGGQILARSSYGKRLAPWILAHHERPDGKGYPSGLAGAEVPLESQIIAVADAFDAMVGAFGEGRTYRQSLPLQQAIEELHRCSGTQFHPRVVAAFCAVVEE